MSDFDFEPIPGLPERPPRGERILWQGSPEWKSMAIHVFHVRKLVIYFAILVAWQMVSSVYDGNSAASTVTSAAFFAGIAGAAIAIVTLLAWGYARSTIYTITDRRIVMRQGLALPLTVNIPFNVISAVDLQVMRDGTGNIASTLGDEFRIAWLALWPSNRPWHFTRPRPSLKSVQDASVVAELLADAITASALQPVAAPAETAPPDQPDRKPAPHSAPQAA